MSTKKIFIIGGSGLVGGNCMRYFSTKSELDVVASYFSYEAKGTVYFNTLDLNDEQNFDVDAFNPDVIIHCGALTWVDYCEDHQEESYEKTVQSTKNAIALCEKYGAKMVYISTDYVFDGVNGPYSEEDKVNPVSVYGSHKLEGEKLVEALPEHLICRITNVYGDEERGKNFIARMIQNALNEKMSLNLPYDQYATPVNAADIARSLYLLLRDEKNGVYNIASTDYVNRCQLAEMVLKYYPGHRVTINPVSTETINPPAERPLQGGLKSEKLLREYPQFKFTNVDDYVKNKIQ